MYGILVPLLVLTFGFSAVGKDKTPSEGGIYWIGASSWAVFGVSLLVTVVVTSILAARALARRSALGGR